MLVFLYNSTKGKTMRLYIIGNGFDMRHGLPTGYKHFKSYVEKNDQDLYDAGNDSNLLIVFYVQIMPD
ncbi:bacteriophage abortive infection AbiH family protein, partial [Escherichia coli]